MNRFILKFLLFIGYLAIVFALLDIVSQTTAPSDDRYVGQFGELFDPQVNADVVILGTSKSVRGINPKLLEADDVAVYNFGLNGSNPEYTYHWYTRFFRKYYPKPKLVLLEVSWLMLNEEIMWRKIEQDSRHFPFLEYCSFLIKPKSWQSAFFNRYYFFNKTIGRGGRLDLTYNGFTPVLKTPKIDPGKDFSDFDPVSQKNYFELLLSSLKHDGMEVLLFVLPEKLSPSVSEQRMVEDKFDLIEKIADKLNLDIINYHNEFSSDSLFYNWGHLNINGANLISGMLRDDIEAHTNTKVYGE